MHQPFSRTAGFIVIIVIGIAVASRAAEKTGDGPKAMGEAMAKMGALNENHQRLEYMVGKWDYRAKIWMDPSAAPQESTGMTETKGVWGGRFYHSDHTGKMEMPGPDGKPVMRDFAGKALTGYDNMKQKFFTAWVDNLSTGILILEGTYDSAAKAFTFRGEMECPMSAPGTKLQIREVVTVVSPDEHRFEWYETRDGRENHTMEISYLRQK